MPTTDRGPFARLAVPVATAGALALVLAGCGGVDKQAAPVPSAPASSSGTSSGSAPGEGGYAQTNLVANDPSYRPQILEPDLKNAWGISLRPAGAGGHFWITASGSGQSIEYVGDVGGKKLYQDELAEITIPGVEDPEQGTPTGTVFNEKGPGFVITQQAGEEEITGPAKFFFATDEGLLTAWTERKNADATFTRPIDSKVVFDRSKAGGQFFGVAISPANDKLYLADFGEKPGVIVLDEAFQPIADARFDSPFPKEYAPFNVQTIGESVFVAYAEQESAGEEEPGPGEGRLAEFSPDGKLIAEWDGGRYLNAPWGIAKAPATGFGPNSGALLVSNFGDGTIAVLDPSTRKVKDFLRRPDGHRVEIDGLWDIKFGNGESLGAADGLYFAAGPGPEADGIFGRLTWSG